MSRILFESKSFKENLDDYPNLKQEYELINDEDEQLAFLLTKVSNLNNFARILDHCEGCANLSILKFIFSGLGTSAQGVLDLITQEGISESDMKDYQKRVLKASRDRIKLNEFSMTTDKTNNKLNMENLADAENIKRYTINDKVYSFVNENVKGNVAINDLIIQAYKYFETYTETTTNLSPEIKMLTWSDEDVEIINEMKEDPHCYLKNLIDPEFFLSIVGNPGQTMLIGSAFYGYLINAENYLKNHEHLPVYELSEDEKRTKKISLKLKSQNIHLSSEEESLIEEYYSHQLYKAYDIVEAIKISGSLELRDPVYKNMIEVISKYARAIIPSVAKKRSISPKFRRIFELLRKGYIDLYYNFAEPINKKLYYGRQLPSNMQSELPKYGIVDVGSFQLAWYGSDLTPGNMSFIKQIPLNEFSSYDLNGFFKTNMGGKPLRLIDLALCTVPKEILNMEEMPVYVKNVMKMITLLAYTNQLIVLVAMHRDVKDKGSLFGFAKNMINYLFWWITKGNNTHINLVSDLITINEPLAYFDQMVQMKNLLRKGNYDFSEVEITSKDTDIFDENQFVDIIFQFLVRSYYNPAMFNDLSNLNKFYKVEDNDELSGDLNTDIYSAFGFEISNIEFLTNDQIAKLCKDPNQTLKYEKVIEDYNQAYSSRKNINSHIIAKKLIKILDSIEITQTDLIAQKNMIYKKEASKALYLSDQATWNKECEKQGLINFDKLDFKFECGATFTKKPNYSITKGKIIDYNLEEYTVTVKDGDTETIYDRTSLNRNNGPTFNQTHLENKRQFIQNLWTKLNNEGSDNVSRKVSNLKIIQTYKWYEENEHQNEKEELIRVCTIIKKDYKHGILNFKLNYYTFFFKNRKDFLTNLRDNAFLEENDDKIRFRVSFTKEEDESESEHEQDEINEEETNNPKQEENPKINKRKGKKNPGNNKNNKGKRPFNDIFNQIFDTNEDLDSQEKNKEEIIKNVLDDKYTLGLLYFNNRKIWDEFILRNYEIDNELRLFPRQAINNLLKKDPVSLLSKVGAKDPEKFKDQLSNQNLNELKGKLAVNVQLESELTEELKQANNELSDRDLAAYLKANSKPGNRISLKEFQKSKTRESVTDEEIKNVRKSFIDAGNNIEKRYSSDLNSLNLMDAFLKKFSKLE